MYVHKHVEAAKTCTLSRNDDVTMETTYNHNHLDDTNTGLSSRTEDKEVLYEPSRHSNTDTRLETEVTYAPGRVDNRKAERDHGNRHSVPSNQLTPRPEQAIGGRRWLVLAASCVNLVVNCSLNYHTGVLYIAVTDYFRSDPIMTSWLMSIYVSMFALAGPLASYVTDKFTCRGCVFLSGLLTLVGFMTSALVPSAQWLFLTLTVVGIGQSFSLIGGTLVLNFYFPTTTAVANGILVCGSGLGIFLHPLLSQALIDHYGLRGTFLLLGAISFNSCVTAMFLRPTDLERKTRLANQQSTCEAISKKFQLLRVPSFVFFLLANLCSSIGYTNTIVYFPEYLVQSGYLATEAAAAVAWIGVGGTLSRLMAGFAAADHNIGEMLLFMGLNAMSGLVNFLGPALVPLTAGPHVFSGAVGIYTGGPISVMSPLTITILGLQRAPFGLGLVYMIFGVGSIIGPPIAATTMHKLGPDSLFYLNGASFLVCVFCCLMSSLTSDPTTPPADPSDQQLVIEVTMEQGLKDDTDRPPAEPPLTAGQVEVDSLVSSPLLTSGGNTDVMTGHTDVRMR